MKVAICNTKNTAKGRYICSAMSEGIRLHGDIPVDVIKWPEDRDKIDTCNVGIQICYLNQYKHTRRNWTVLDGIFRRHIYARCSQLNKRMITVDTAFMHNEHDAKIKGVIEDKITDTDKATDNLDNVYYSVGFDNIKNKAKYYNEDKPSDRFNALNIELLPWKTTGKSIVIVGQTIRGVSSQNVDIYRWYKKIIFKIRKAYPRIEIIIKLHPRVIRRGPNKQNTHIGHIKAQIQSEKYVTISKQLHMSKVLADAKAVIVFSSNAAVDSLINGVYTISCDDYCITHPITNLKIRTIAAPIFPERKQFFYNLAYAQWSCKEMRRGLVWEHLKNHV